MKSCAVAHECGCRHASGEFCAAKVPIFSNLANEQLAMITKRITRRRYKKGQVVFWEGDLSDRFVIVHEGKIKIFRYTREGKEQILYILSEGDFLGDLSLLKKGVFQSNGEAIEDVSVCTIAKDDFDKILKENPEISLRILESVHDRLEKLENLVQTLSTKDMEARIASLLINFAKNFGYKRDDRIVLDLSLTREEMANFIGVTRETMSRKLSSMQEEGFIELVGNKRIIINNLEDLEDLT
ncbi:MAG: Crp/Fnr family transcriptional regulator [Desulfitobacterium sp.]|nr:Crp/Fnr family transcriptional regulator [Desulfitobacterium sp.]